nr:nickel pincer cofactor biosynthesis protein LarB [uncultured Dethiosulfovibrio sp.]
MDRGEVLALALKLKKGELSPDDFVNKVNLEPFEDLGEVKLDHNRALRRGFAEIVYCPGKSDDQLRSIAKSLADRSGTFLFSRVRDDQVDLLTDILPGLIYHEKARLAAVVRSDVVQQRTSGVTVVAAGSSDVPVAEEAAFTAYYMGCDVKKIYDVGVAGIHRLLAHAGDLMESKVIVAVAGMEGALPGVVAGLVSCPVIAVPTSVGYGANFGGLSALLTMINSCATGVTVVNIDNGLGAGYTAGMIARQSV